MDCLQFISSIVSSLAWPSVVLFIFCVLWYYFPKFAPFVRQLKYGDIEVNFHEQAIAVAAAADALPVIPAPEPLPADVEGAADSAVVHAPALDADAPAVDPTPALPETQITHDGTFKRDASIKRDGRIPYIRDLSDRKALEKLADSSPKDAVLSAWSIVNEALLEALKPLLPETSMPPSRVTVEVFKRNFFSSAQMNVFNQLETLRNEIEHNASVSVSSSSAIEYIQAAWTLKNSIRSTAYVRAHGYMPDREK